MVSCVGGMDMKRITSVGFWATLGLVVGSAFWAAKIPAAQAQQDERVLLNIEITDSNGHYISGLHPKDFRVLEDGIVQEINTFAEKENSYEVTYFPAKNP